MGIIRETERSTRNIFGNVIQVSLVLDHKKHTITGNLPNIELDNDEAIGEMGYKIGQLMEVINLRVAEIFNESVKEK